MPPWRNAQECSSLTAMAMSVLEAGVALRRSEEKGKFSLFLAGEYSEVELTDPLPQLVASRARGISRPRVR